MEDELSKIVKPTSEINNGTLSKMGFTKIGGRWVSKDGDQAGLSGVQIDGENEVVAAGDEPTRTHEVGPSTAHMDECITSLSPFEKLMVRRMDNFVDNQMSLYELCDTRF